MKNKIKNLLLTSALLVGVNSFAGEDFAKDRLEKGYTYFSILSTQMNYTSSYTTSGGDKIETDATSQNPVYVAGALYVVTDSIDISTEITTTLLPQRANETWTSNGTEVQTNNSDMMSNNIQLLGHYKFSDEHRVIFGGTYNISSYKRYNFVQGGVATNFTVVEQRSKSLALQTGYWYEGYYLNNSALHVNFRAIIGLPVYVATENTASDEIYNNLGGYNADIYLSVGYNVFKTSEVGAIMGYSVLDRDGEGDLPQNTTTNFYLGLYFSF